MLGPSAPFALRVKDAPAASAYSQVAAAPARDHLLPYRSGSVILRFGLATD